MPKWREEATAIERARELGGGVDATEAAEWNQYAWNERGELTATVADAARDVAHKVEALQLALRRFIAEHEVALRRAGDASDSVPDG